MADVAAGQPYEVLDRASTEPMLPMETGQPFGQTHVTARRSTLHVVAALGAVLLVATAVVGTVGTQDVSLSSVDVSAASGAALGGLSARASAAPRAAGPAAASPVPVPATVAAVMPAAGLVGPEDKQTAAAAAAMFHDSPDSLVSAVSASCESWNDGSCDCEGGGFSAEQCEVIEHCRRCQVAESKYCTRGVAGCPAW